MLDNKTTIKQFQNQDCNSTIGTDSEILKDCQKIGYDFKRLLFFYNDGLARDLSDDLVNMFNASSNTFRIQNEGFPASYAVFTSYVTGTPPTNYMGASILNDNIINQLVKSKIPMQYYGTRMPAYDVLEEGKYFNKVQLEYITHHTAVLYKSLFKCNTTVNATETQCVQEFLDEMKQSGQSIFFSGDVVDERNHQTGDKYDPVTLDIIKEWIGNMEIVKDWVDNNPEYLLVMISDHGGKLKSETAAHGDNNNGNEAFMIIYSPKIKPLPKELQDTFIDQVDVCSTVWQHFSGSDVSLPAENIGKVFPTNIDKTKIYSTLKVNAEQLNSFAKLWDYGTNQKLFDKAIKAKESGDLNESIKLFTQYINALKTPFLNLKRFPWLEVIMYPCIITGLVISLLCKQYGSLIVLGKECKTNFALVFIPYLIITGITGLFSGFWVLYWHDDNESIHMFVASLLAILLMHYGNIGSNSDNNNSKNINKLETDEENSLDDNEIELKKLVQNENNNDSSSRNNDNYNNINLYSFEYKKPSSLIITYSLFSFFMAVSIFLLTVPLEDLLLVHLYKKSYFIAAIFLIIEFIIQKRKITVHLILNESDNFKSSGCYLPLYIKFITYFLLLIGIYIYDQAWRNHKIMYAKLAFIIYLVIGLHSFVLIFSKKYLQTDLFLPFSMMLFFLSNDKERFYLVLFVIPQLYSISNVFYFKLFNTFKPILLKYKNYYSKNGSNESSNSTNIENNIYYTSLKDSQFFNGVTDHFLPFVILLMTAIALSCYKLMKMNFQIGDVAIYVPGVYDPPTKPVFSGFVMGFHKLGYFFLLGSFLIKLSNPCPPALVPRYWSICGNKPIQFGLKSKSNHDFKRISESLNTQVWGFLMLLLLASLFFFHLGYYNFMIIKSFVFTVTISVIVIFFGTTMVTTSIGSIITILYKRIISKNNTKSNFHNKSIGYSISILFDVKQNKHKKDLH